MSSKLNDGPTLLQSPVGWMALGMSGKIVEDGILARTSSHLFHPITSSRPSRRFMFSSFGWGIQTAPI